LVVAWKTQVIKEIDFYFPRVKPAMKVMNSILYRAANPSEADWKERFWLMLN